MQVYEVSLGKGGRPCPGSDCPRYGGGARLHKHGSFSRWRGLGRGQRVTVQRYICPRCRRTWSVIPAGMVPYHSMEVVRFEQLADTKLAGGGARPPPASESEEDCIRRALKRLSERITLLCGLFGQQMPAPVGTGIGPFWRALRGLGSTMDNLLWLAREFKTSLLWCYRSLLPHWEREMGPAPAS